MNAMDRRLEITNEFLPSDPAFISLLILFCPFFLFFLLKRRKGKKDKGLTREHSPGTRYDSPAHYLLNLQFGELAKSLSWFLAVFFFSVISRQFNFKTTNNQEKKGIRLS